MHGLVNRSIQCFVQDTYGIETWHSIATSIGVGPEGFESLLVYDDGLSDAFMAAVVRQLNKPKDMLLEDVGTYLVSNPNKESIRRLMRFGGDTFVDFLHSLEDLPDRARLAVCDLELPTLALLDDGTGTYTLHVSGRNAKVAYVLLGILRAMADDYGALVLLELRECCTGDIAIDIGLLDTAFAEGRSFSLSPRRLEVQG
ncbi:heme NO-binding domain-containing protein [Tropicimonas isoalkanivorans]|uniref:Haem-NO-binding n=1 Tax=Tropicimonas isoalkanivorans TaxID=441112 RepID=A0A1I1LGC7_9RHOB|nr:heme NO-binding domain-containing protein [Tropicimonas isoalkanivorans]SFC70058.1 Haem-NO-binding [Tropicimonas isoalkanivorans]